jgi:hypothetical protein
MPLVRGVDVHVHVDETGGEKPIPGVNYRCAGRDGRHATGADGHHPITVDYDGYWLSRASTRPVDQGAADNRDHGLRNISNRELFSVS